MSAVSRSLVGVPAGMESEDECSDDDFTSPAKRQQVVNGSTGAGGEKPFERGGDNQNALAEASGAGNDGRQTSDDEAAPDDDLEGIFDNGVPVDETVKISSDPEEKPSFGFKNINEIVGQQSSFGRSGHRVSFDEQKQPERDGQKGGKRRRIEKEDEDDDVTEYRSLDKPRSYSRWFNAFRFKSEPFAEPREDLENVLHIVDMAHLLPLFRNQDIGLKEFLIMNRLDFEKLGVNTMGECMRLEQLVVDIHAKPWSEKSLIEPGPNFAVPEAVKMVSNVHGHLVCMEASLFYLRQISDKKKLIPSDRQNFNKLLREVDSTVLAIPMFEKRLRELRKTLQRMAGSVIGPDPRADVTDADTKLVQTGCSWDRIKKSALIVAVPLAVYAIYRNISKA